jgi:16S rRNA (cytosine1402-N4)-methyltransferase
MGRLSRRMVGGDSPPRLRMAARWATMPAREAIDRPAAAGWPGQGRSKRANSTRTPLSHASEYHSPALVEEVLGYLQPSRGGVFLDGTLGGGGHAEALLEASDKVRVIGVDRDPEARIEAVQRLSRFGDRVTVIGGNFADAITAAGIGERELAGVLLDLGISSHQVDLDVRGFTFRPGAPLDMRMEGSGPERSAADLLNTLDDEDLANIFFLYGEERRSRRLARVIVEMRRSEPFSRSDQLAQAIARVIPRPTPQDLARIFQALRIAVNGETESLERALPVLRDALERGGTLAVISYHSLEDRLVKEAFRDWSRECVCPPGLPICVCRGKPLGTLLTRKPVMASPAEVEANPRARSARLRAWRKA